MQIKDHFLLSKKQYEDEIKAENKLQKELEYWFGKVLTKIQSKLNDDFNEYKYLFQVEEIVKEYKQEYLDILADNIQEFYINHSEIIEATTNNILSMKMLDQTLLLDIANKKQTKIEDYLDYNYQTDQALSEQIRRKLRFNNNIQDSLNRYLTFELDLTGFSTSDIPLEDLLQYEIDQAVIEYMGENVFTASESTMARVTQKIYDVIKESYATEGHGINKVTEDIQNKFNELKKFEAERIARTETLKAQGHSTYKRLINNTNIDYIQWSSTHDKRTRLTHRKIDGEITYADGSGIFSNGLRFPGDTNGDISEWINCRCTIRAYIPEIGFVAPIGMTSWQEKDMVFDESFSIPEVNVELDEYLASYW